MKLPLPALTGSEPLAFLAALGALRGLSRRWPAARLAWVGDAPFQPELDLPDDATADLVVETLVVALRHTEKLECFSRLGSDVKVAPDEYRRLLEELRARDDEAARASLDYLYALGNEMVADGSGKKLKPTAWHMTAGQQQFLEMARVLLRETSTEHLSAALFKPWQYADPPPAMRWDTTGERLYALEARNPSSAQIRTVRGANALGFLALPFFPVSVAAGRARPSLRTRGFVRDEYGVEHFVWPVWRSGITAQTLPFLLGDLRLAALPAQTASLRISGVAGVFRSERYVNDHGYGTLRPAEQTL